MPKIAIVGGGSVGLFYAAKLLENLRSNSSASNLDISIFLRREYQSISTFGFCLHDLAANKDICFNAEDLRGCLFNDANLMVEMKGQMDWIFVCVKSYSISESISYILRRLSHESTKFIIIMNGYNVEKHFVNWFGGTNIFGAITTIACTRENSREDSTEPFHVYLTANGKLEIAHYNDDELELESARQLFCNLQDISFEFSSNLLKTRWKKLCFNLPFSGLSLAMGGITVDIIRKDESLCELARKIIEDVVRVANFDMEYQYECRILEGRDISKPEPIDLQAMLEYIFAKSHALKPYKMSAVVDLINNAPFELEYLFQEPYKKSKELHEIYLQKYSSSLSISHLESVVLIIEGISRIADLKKAKGIPWKPTYIEDMM